MKIQIPYVANLFEYASYKGISEEVLRNYLIDKDIDVCNPETTVTDTEYLTIFEYLLKTTADDNFGIHYGCYLNIKAMGFIVQLSLNASSIEQAVFILQSYLQNTFPLVSIQTTEKNGKYTLGLTSEIKNEKLKSHVLDFVFCFIYRELLLMLSTDLILEMEVPKSNAAEFSDFLKAKFKKGRTHHFVFETTVLSTEINRSKIKEVEILLPKYLMMLDKKKSGYKAFSTQVRKVILNMTCPELPTFDQVASHFPLSNRSIQRKLNEEGFSFRKISDDIKRELASYLSKGYRMKTLDVAYLLGYKDSSSYLHAVKKWGKSK